MESKSQLLELLSKNDDVRNQYLKELFKYLPEALAREMIYTEIKQGHYVLMAGSPSDTVYFVLKGQVSGLDYSRKGEAYSFMDFTHMYVIGDFEVFHDYAEYSVSIRAEQDCEMLKIPSDRYLQWIRHDENALFLRISNILSVLTAERKVYRKYLHMSCKERLAMLLATYYEEGKKDETGLLKVRETQSELANKIGFNVRSVQRGITSLEKEDQLSTAGGKIFVTHEQYLKLRQNQDN